MLFCYKIVHVAAPYFLCVSLQQVLLCEETVSLQGIKQFYKLVTASSDKSSSTQRSRHDQRVATSTLLPLTLNYRPQAVESSIPPKSRW